MGIVRWNDQATRWIDGLSTVTRLRVWAGISLAAALTVVEVLAWMGSQGFRTEIDRVPLRYGNVLFVR